MTAPLLSIRELTVAYAGRTVSSMPELDLHPGRCVAIVGESGSGKSTVLHASMGLLAGTQAQVSGAVRVGDVDMVTSTERQMADVRGSRIAMVMQSPQGSLNPVLPLRTLARRAMRRHGIGRREADARIAVALERVRLDPVLLDRLPYQLSGGQAQRFAIGLAAALGADVIAADEPTSALDVTVQAEVIGVLEELRREQGTAVLLVSHDLALVSTVADEIIVMQAGRVVDRGTVTHILEESNVPYTRALIDAIPTVGATWGGGDA